MQLYIDAGDAEIKLMQLEHARIDLNKEIKETRENRCTIMDKIRTLHQEISEVNIEPFPDTPDSVIRVK